MPEEFVVTVAVLLNVDELKLASDAPVVIVNSTGVVNTGAPVALRSVTLTTAWLEILSDRGLIVTVMLAAAGGAGEPMVNDALLLTVPAVALMSIMELFPAATAVNVTDATPEALVVAVAAGVKLPAAETLAENVTVWPLMGNDDASRTVAETEVLPPFPIVVDPSDTTTEAGTWTGVPIVIGAVPLIVLVPTVTLARIVAVAFTAAPAVNTDVAWPDAFVTAEAGLNDPAVELITEKETLTFGITTEELSITVAVTFVVPLFAMVDEERDT